MSACGIAGLINLDGTLEDGKRITQMITALRERENGLGAGFAVYGCFPEYANQYCLQMIMDGEPSRTDLEAWLRTRVAIVKDEQVFTRPVKTLKPPYPLVRRYFINPKTDEDDDDFVLNLVAHINTQIKGVFCLSSGKNMAVFKGSGWSDDIADFFDLNRYQGYLWLAHSRFPTNTSSWWGGAHPFNILDWSVCHNGEITSYGTNKRYVEMMGYKCAMATDSEVIVYLWDFLVRKQHLPLEIAATILAPKYYQEIDSLEDAQKRFFNALRRTYRFALANGPFSILVANSRPQPTLIALTDRKKLRPLVAGLAQNQKTAFVASEESAIRILNEELQDVWTLTAGNPFIAKLNGGIVNRGLGNGS